MKKILDIGKSKNLIITIAIGEKYYNSWLKNASKLWINYCKKYDLGLFVIDSDLISKKDKSWKKATWQKLLIPECLSKAGIKVERVCYLDTDILISPFAPNIFDFHENETVGLTSIRHELPFPLERVQRKMAFQRHTNYSNSYPLDSALFLSMEKMYEFHGLDNPMDECCMGLIVFNPNIYGQQMKESFYKYLTDVKSITDGGDQTHINYELHSFTNVSKLDYKFQAIWPYEMAWYYEFLYRENYQLNKILIRDCIESCLTRNHFLHFAGSWHESEMFNVGKFFEDENIRNNISKFQNYLQKPVKGEIQGTIKPKIKKYT